MRKITWTFVRVEKQNLGARAHQFRFSLPPRRSHRSGIAAWASGRSAPQLLGRSSACWTKCKGCREWPRRSASLLWSEAVPACRFSSKAAPAPPPPPDSSPNSLGSDARYFAITPGYFGTMRIPNSVGRRRRPRIEADRAPGGDCDLDRSRARAGWLVRADALLRSALVGVTARRAIAVDPNIALRYE